MHTLEPWTCELEELGRFGDYPRWVIRGAKQGLVRTEVANFDYRDEDTALRVLACVNGCAGIANPAAVGELVEALRSALPILKGVADTLPPDRSGSVVYRMVRAAIAKATATEAKSPESA